MAKSCQQLPAVTNICQKLPKVARSCQKLPTVANNCQQLPNDAKSCQKLTWLRTCGCADGRTDRWASWAAVAAKKGGHHPQIGVTNFKNLNEYGKILHWIQKYPEMDIRCSFHLHCIERQWLNYFGSKFLSARFGGNITVLRYQNYSCAEVWGHAYPCVHNGNGAYMSIASNKLLSRQWRTLFLTSRVDILWRENISEMY